MLETDTSRKEIKKTNRKEEEKRGGKRRIAAT